MTCPTQSGAEGGKPDYMVPWQGAKHNREIKKKHYNVSTNTGFCSRKTESTCSPPHPRAGGREEIQDAIRSYLRDNKDKRTESKALADLGEDITP